MTTVDAIKKLHTSMIDTRNAYKKALAEAEQPQLKALFEDMVAMRVKHHEQLHRVLIPMGEEPDEGGSFMTAVHKAVIGVRSAVKGIDEDALASFASGEESIVKEYDDALAQGDLHAETSDLLQRHRTVLLEPLSIFGTRHQSMEPSEPTSATLRPSPSAAY